MREKNILWLSLVALLLINTMVGIELSQTTTRMYVDPSAIVDPTKSVGSVFTVNVNVEDVISLYGWSFKLLFNPSIVQVTTITIPYPSFLSSAGPSMVLAKKYDNVAGYALVSETLKIPYPKQGAGGSGTLATISFTVVGVGVTALNLSETKLNTVVAGNNVPMEHMAEDGVFDNRAANMPPVAMFSAEPPMGVEGDTITFDASASYDDGWIVSYFWDFGDGTNATGKIVQHTWSAGYAGVYTVTLTITDNNAVSSSSSLTVEILTWMEAGAHPDLVKKMAWPEIKHFSEVKYGEHENLWARVGNPTDSPYEVRVDFNVYSKDWGVRLGTVSSASVTVLPHEITEISADFYLADPRWKVVTGPWDWPYWVKKYLVIAQCVYNEGGEWKAGRFMGEFQFKVYPVNHDRAIIAVTAEPNPAKVGENVAITVTVENQGQQVETFTITVAPFGYASFGTATVTLAAGENATRTFTWSTSGLEPGNYVILANIDAHPYERDTTDNTMHVVVVLQ